MFRLFGYIVKQVFIVVDQLNFSQSWKLMENLGVGYVGTPAGFACICQNKWDTKKPRVAGNLHNSIQRKEKRIERRTFSNFLAAFPCMSLLFILKFH